MDSTLTHVLSHVGLIAIVIVMLLESCGIPIPSEVTMPFAGALAAGGHFPLVAAIGAGVLGETLGAMLAYFLADRFGTKILLGPGKYVGISAHHLSLAQEWFATKGIASVFVGRLVPVIRTYISFPAGLAKMPFARFVITSIVGSVIWCTGLTIAGYFLGEAYTHLGPPFHVATIIGILLIIIGVIAWLVHGRMHKQVVVE